jgi:hypothetical protein
MRTDDLIAALAADNDSKSEPLSRSFARDVAIGGVVTALGFFLFLGVRHNFFDSLTSPRFLFKFVFTGTMTLSGLFLAWRLARPDAAPRGAAWAALLGPALVLLACGVEMMLVPSALWAQRMWGQNFWHCLIGVPTFAAAPLAGLFFFLKDAAPVDPRRAGAVAAFAACGLGATFYAANCPDDSPFYVAVWYLLATAMVTVFGWLAGGRLLRW